MYDQFFKEKDMYDFYKKVFSVKPFFLQIKLFI